MSVTLFPGFTYQVSDVIVVLGVVLGVAIVALIVRRMFMGP